MIQEKPKTFTLAKKANMREFLFGNEYVDVLSNIALPNFSYFAGLKLALFLINPPTHHYLTVREGSDQAVKCAATVKFQRHRLV